MNISLQIISKGIIRVLAAGLIFSTYQVNCAATADTGSLEILDKRFQQFSRDYYDQIIKQDILPLKKYDSVSELKQKVNEYAKAGKSISAIALIHHNHRTIRDNIDATEIIPLTALLLKFNDWHEAKRIFDYAREDAGKPAISNLSFEFSKYFIQRKKWQQALGYLNDIINELSVENANYAQLMIGTILQNQKKHRQAIKYYKKIDSSSKHYTAAVLNIAVAYIRQDWWTDAHNLIIDTIKNHDKQLSNIMVDRLNLMLGYALLRKEYFRNSRDVFRNIRLNSPYTNKALLGIVLTAANQEDYIGSLNAIILLKDKKTTDLPVDESYLLLPYTYGKLKQNLTASSAYTDAMKYYQERISGLQDIMHSGKNVLGIVKIVRGKNILLIKSNELNYTRQYPASFFDNYLTLMALETNTNGLNKLNRQFKMLAADYKKTLRTISLQLLAQRIEYLQSYLNQARFGLARLYDSSLISAK